MKKLRVGVIYGGRSGEHEVSIASAAAVFKHLDRTRYDPVAIRIEKDGRWTLADRPPTALAAADVIEQARLASAHSVRPGREAHLVSYPAQETLLTIDRAARGADDERARVTGLGLDVVFPVLHGPYGEDGTVQGLLELANVPYVGAGVLASAVGMDKAFMKIAFAARGLPVGPYRVLLAHQWRADADRHATSMAEALGYPMFVKPANLGSSVGISKAKSLDDLRAALALAFQYDRKAVIEAAVPAAREIEVGVLGNESPEASVPGEIIPGREFYDYGWRSRRFWPSTARGWHASTSSWRARPASCSSTKSTRCPASRRSACTRSCGRLPGSTTRHCSTGSSRWRRSGTPPSRG
jgi:D-alanine-D-alanine ligase